MKHYFEFGQFYLSIPESLQNVPKESILLSKLLKDHSKDIRPLPKKVHGPTIVNITVMIVQTLEIVRILSS